MKRLPCFSINTAPAPLTISAHNINDRSDPSSIKPFGTSLNPVGCTCTISKSIVSAPIARPNLIPSPVANLPLVDPSVCNCGATSFNNECSPLSFA